MNQLLIGSHVKEKGPKLLLLFIYSLMFSLETALKIFLIQFRPNIFPKNTVSMLTPLVRNFASST